MLPIEVYSRRGCHLCDILIEELLPLLRGRLEVVIHDIDTRADWQRKYDTQVPVVTYDGEPICTYHLDREALSRILNSAPHEPNS